jgi:hypothetical protein
MTTSHTTTSHEVDREYRGHREYRPVGEAAWPKSVVTTLALIIGAAVVVLAGAVAGMTFLAMPLPAHPTAVVAAPATHSSVIIRA